MPLIYCLEKEKLNLFVRRKNQNEPLIYVQKNMGVEIRDGGGCSVK